MGYTSSSETTSFYRDHRHPLSHQFLLPLPFLCVTTQEDIWLFSMLYQSSRRYMWAYIQAHLPEHSVQLLLWTLPHSRAISRYATSQGNQVGSRALPQSNNFYEVCSLLPPDLSHVTHPPTSTLYLYSSLLAPWECLVSSFLKAFVHAVCSTPKIFSYPFYLLHQWIPHSSALQRHFLRGVIPACQIRTGYYLVFLILHSFSSENKSYFVIMHLLISVCKFHKGGNLIYFDHCCVPLSKIVPDT